MFGNLGAGEIAVLAVIVLLVFGANRLPEAGRAVGKGMREFQRALRETRDELERPDEPRAAAPRTGAPRRLVE